MIKSHITIGTRGSQLALWQANFVKDKLEALGIEVTLKIIQTKGDRIQHLSFDKIEGKGFFTKEIEDCLLRGQIDMAVHSMKDLPTTSPEGLVITAVSYRDNPSDWLLIRKESVTKNKLFKLKEGAIVGSSSARRKAQMLDFRPDVVMKDVRGNVPTRIRKLRNGDFDGIILAAAGISRLNIDLSDLELVKMNPKEFVAAPAQGVLAYQTCDYAKDIRRVLKHIHHSEVSACTNVERKVLKLMNGGCQMPLGVYCEKDANNNYHVWAAKSAGWNTPVARVQLSSSTSSQLAEKVVLELKKKAMTSQSTMAQMESIKD